ncbi:hypothetical protein HDU92_007586 [Lobulomyces angularis]|nr:hypothetical protein HDU92_007586 [Lobulomyces angularis]
MGEIYDKIGAQQKAAIWYKELLKRAAVAAPNHSANHIGNFVCKVVSNSSTLKEQLQQVMMHHEFSRLYRSFQPKCLNSEQMCEISSDPKLRKITKN